MPGVSKPIRLIIAGDHEMMRAKLVTLLERGDLRGFSTLSSWNSRLMKPRRSLPRFIEKIPNQA